MTPMGLGMSAKMEALFEADEMVHVRFLRTESYDDTGVERYVSWRHMQHPVSGCDVYRVAAVTSGNCETKIRVEWYISQTESLQRYDETVMVHRENSLGDNAHPN